MAKGYIGKKMQNWRMDFCCWIRIIFVIGFVGGYGRIFWGSKLGDTNYSAGKEVMKIAKNIAKAARNGFKSAGRAIGSGIKSAGLSLGIYAVPTSVEIALFFENQGMQYVTEEVLWKNLEKILLKDCICFCA